MGKKDISIRGWLKDKVRFADLFNGIVFDGQPIVKPEELEVIDSEADILLETKGKTARDKKQKSMQRYRDIVMRWHDEMDLAILACENQEKVHYAMPVRTMLYDSLSYTEQMRVVWQNLSEEEKADIQTEELFSRFRKEDQLFPVITIVLYYGQEEWGGSCSLHELFGFSNGELLDILKRYVPDYRINLIDVSRITERTQFQTDLQIMFGMLPYRQDKEALLNYIQEHKDYYSHLDYEARQAMAGLLESDKLCEIIEKDTGKDEKNMCKALDDYFDEAFECGVKRGIERGKREGVKLERENSIRNIISVLKDAGKSEEYIRGSIIKIYSLSDDEVILYM